MSELTQLLVANGIAKVEAPFSPAFLTELNAKVDDILDTRKTEARAYVHYDELARLGLLAPLLTGGMRHLLTAIVPDPVLYHCHIYEIAGNSTRSHIFSESLGGWHRDPDSEFDGCSATHVSIFLYLSDVGVEDGPFEFCPQTPGNWPHRAAPTITVTGPRGYCFTWNRAFFHRAAPNRGPRRRRLLKLSIQPNAFPNQHMATDRFAAVRDMMPAGDPYLDVLLGRHLGGTVPTSPASSVTAEPIAPTGTLDISHATILKAIARDKARVAKRWLNVHGARPQSVPYD